MQLILAIWRSAASTCWHNIQTLRSFITVIKPFLTLIIQSLLINEINLYHLFLTKKKKKKNQYRAFNYAGPALSMAPTPKGFCQASTCLWMDSR
jgi:hypothetical protein